MIYVTYTCCLGALKMATENRKSVQTAAAGAAATLSSPFTKVFAMTFALAALASCSSDSAADGEQHVDADSGTDGPGDPIDSGALDLGDPITVEPTEQWTWVPIDGTMCADGTTAGVGVNFTTQSRNLLIFFQGNGVCYDPFTCMAFQNLLTGMGPDPLNHLWWGTPITGQLGIFDRADPNNPLRQDNFVVFPHCGVDGHTADKESTYPPMATVQQRGYANVTAAIQRIVPTFLDASRIVVAGFSAGGIGCGANYHQIATAFAAVGKPPPYLIDDAGPVLPQPYLGPMAHSALRAGWGLDQTLEPWCTDCATEGYHAVHETLARLHPGLRSSVICSYNDSTVTALYSLLNGGFDGAMLDAGLRELSAQSASVQADVAPSVQHEFYYPGARHGALVVAPLSVTPGLTEFLNDQLNDSPTWATIHQ